MANNEGGEDRSIEYGDDVQFGNAASDYSTYRATYPEELFERLQSYDVGFEGQSILDVGTGTGFLAQAFATHGCHVTGVDLDRALLREATERE